MFGTSCMGSWHCSGGHGWLGVCMGTLQPHQAPHQQHGRCRSWHSYRKEAGAGRWQSVCCQASDKAGFSCLSACLAVGLQLGLYHVTTAPVHLLCFNVLS